MQQLAAAFGALRIACRLCAEGIAEVGLDNLGMAEVVLYNLFGSPLLFAVASVELKRLVPYDLVLAKTGAVLSAAVGVCVQTKVP